MDNALAEKIQSTTFFLHERKRCLAIQNAGYECWGKLYELIFAKGFMLDEEDKTSLEHRLNVLENILKQGALAVTRCHKNLSDNGWAARRMHLIDHVRNNRR